MNILKKLVNNISHYVLAVLLGLSLPFLLILVWVKSIFSDDIKDHTKVKITKEVIIILGLFIIFAIINIYNPSS